MPFANAAASTKVLLSSVVTLPKTERAFALAKELKFDGLEIFPYRWTNPAGIAELSARYQVPIAGVHVPFWWHTKPLRKVITSETLLREKVFACVWASIFGAGHLNCPAVKLLKEFPEAYCLIHPDTFEQSLFERDHFLTKNRLTFLENERPKKGTRDWTHDPFLIRSHVFPLQPECYRLMFDPGHVLLAQEQGHIPKMSVSELYEQLRPEGLHLSFSGDGRLHDLPTAEEWKGLAKQIKQHPPRFIVVETSPGSKAELKVVQARQMILFALGI